jgi:hypothetical protein
VFKLIAPTQFHSPLLGDLFETSANYDENSRVICSVDSPEIYLPENRSKKSYRCIEYVMPQNSVSGLAGRVPLLRLDFRLDGM